MIAVDSSVVVAAIASWHELHEPARAALGGAAYDALIAAVARGASAKLLTCDRRAGGTYERVGAAVEYLA